MNVADRFTTCLLPRFSAEAEGKFCALRALQLPMFAMHQRSFACREVLALEHMVIKYVQLLEPLYQWKRRSHDPEQFLLLKDNIFDKLDEIDASSLPAEHQQRVAQADAVRQDIVKGLGTRWLFKRSLPPELTHGGGAEGLKAEVRLW